MFDEPVHFRGQNYGVFIVLALRSLPMFGAVGCSKTYIPNTDVLDNTENRKVILFCEQYRHAVEEKNVGQLLKLASPAYHRKGVGNNDDDVDYVSLKEFLTTTFQQTDAIRYEIRYRRGHLRGDEPRSRRLHLRRELSRPGGEEGRVAARRRRQPPRAGPRGGRLQDHRRHVSAPPRRQRPRVARPRPRIGPPRPRRSATRSTIGRASSGEASRLADTSPSRFEVRLGGGWLEGPARPEGARRAKVILIDPDGYSHAVPSRRESAELTDPVGACCRQERAGSRPVARRRSLRRSRPRALWR